MTTRQPSYLEVAQGANPTEEMNLNDNARHHGFAMKVGHELDHQVSEACVMRPYCGNQPCTAYNLAVNSNRRTYRFESDVAGAQAVLCPSRKPFGAIPISKLTTSSASDTA